MESKYKRWLFSNFELFQRKNPKSNSDYEKLFGKAASPLLVSLDEIPDKKKELNYNIYMDNLFSSPTLFSFLRLRGYSAIGTIRQNRIPKQNNKTGRKKVSQLDLKIEIVNVYLRKYQNGPKAIGRPSTSIFSTDSCISDSIRFDKVDHLIKPTEDKKKKRCAGKKCNVGLCADCFIPFHSL